MFRNFVSIVNRDIPVISLHSVIAGSGAAGLNAAKRLYDFGQKDIAIITEGLKKGTSRNTGSDKQTYYKLNLSGQKKDSIYDMARTYFEGGAMHGDLARVEAALSVRSFFHLVEIGVPFPHSAYGEYVGYKTDHDPGQRATSAGPLTSYHMTEKLEEEVLNRNITIFDHHQLVGVLLSPKDKQVLGLMAIDLKKIKSSEEHFVLFNCRNVVYATGGPAKIYQTTVYPESQTGAHGLAFESGVKGQNLTESQFGLSSLKFRWNLSGTYQQVIPRYVSTNADGGDEKEFLAEYYSNPGKMINAIFLKGYQWPFDPRKLKNQGSSFIDLLVYQERIEKKRKVWLDYTQNPVWASNEFGELDFNLLNKEAYSYLKNSDVLFGSPLDRLRKMNKPAYQLYKENDIDLAKEKLEIAVCAQHNNGGLLGNKWWESNIKNFFPVGEANGSHGIYRPGGSALNAGQVGSLRAADFIVNRYESEPLSINDFKKLALDKIVEKIEFAETIQDNTSGCSPAEILENCQNLMSENGAIIRSLPKIQDAIVKIGDILENLKQKLCINSKISLKTAFHLQDCLITQLVYLKSIKNYINEGGRSRGSYLIIDKDEQRKYPLKYLLNSLNFEVSQGEKKDLIQTVSYNKSNQKCNFQWIKRRPLKKEKYWFENEWEKFRQGEIYFDLGGKKKNEQK